MKIEAYEIAMQSKHVEFKSMVESKMSFETYLVDEPINGIENLERLQKAQRRSVDLNTYLFDRSRTLEGIIQNLISMLQDRRMKSDETSQDDVMGYSHLSYKERYEEHESVSFSTTGHVKTDKGCIDLNLNFSMSRSFIVENSLDIYTAFDPLVINLDGELPNLLEDTFSFDLDNDGKKDQISELSAGSGFLALDKNKDGKINQGSELFGTITGNGFGELSAYDEDKNSWIDENDSIFDSLRIWLRNEEKNEKELIAIGEVGIGAIYLNSESSQFRYKTNTNQVLGEMKSAGIFLKENGEVGNISQIDFTAQNTQDKPEAKVDQALAKLLQT